MHLLTQLLPAQLSNSVELAWCKVADHYSKTVLTRHEKIVWNSFGSNSRRREYLSSRWLVRKMTEYMDMEPDQFFLKKDDGGRPYGLYQGNRYDVSIAHTPEDTICAISPDLKIGVDMEAQNRSFSEQLRARLLNKPEQSQFAGEEIMRLWTLKEAILKLQGSGLRTRLKEWALISNKKALFIAENHKKKRVNIYSFSHQNNWIALAFYPQKTSIV